MHTTLRLALHRKALGHLDARISGFLNGNEETLRNRADLYLRSELSATDLSEPDRNAIHCAILDELFAYGPITPLLSDPTVSEIMVNGHRSVYIEREGKLLPAGVGFASEDSLRATIDRMVSRVNRRLDESSPFVDARLPDGSRVNAVIPPISLSGCCLTIRKFRPAPFSMKELVRNDMLTEDAAGYLGEAVRQRMNIIVSGGTGAGKTTLLNALSRHVPDGERIVTIEDAAEIRLLKPHVVRLEARPPNIEGKGIVSIRDLVRNSLRMRPDRIIVGECRGGEALDMLQAMNTGHDGSITTGHANSPRDMLRRLETMVLLSGVEIPVKAIREQIASAIDLIVHVCRVPDGERKLSSIVEVTGTGESQILLQEIFHRTKGNPGGNTGPLRPTGVPSKFMSRITKEN